MTAALTLITLAGTLLFSVSCAALLEELIFGGLFRLFFAPRRQHPEPTTQPGRR